MLVAGFALALELAAKLPDAVIPEDVVLTVVVPPQAASSAEATRAQKKYFTWPRSARHRPACATQVNGQRTQARTTQLAPEMENGVKASWSAS